MRNPRLDLLTMIVFSSQSVPLGGTLTSGEIDLTGAEGYLGLYVALTGTGTISLSYKMGIFPGYFASPPTIYSLLTGHTAALGPLTDGKTYLWFNPPVGKYLQLIATETGGAASPVLTVHLVIA